MTDRDAMVQHPAHYIEGRKYEPIDVLLDWFATDPLLWQVGKYISRAGRKGPALQDLQKAKFYLERAIVREHEIARNENAKLRTTFFQKDIK